MARNAGIRSRDLEQFYYRDPVAPTMVKEPRHCWVSGDLDIGYVEAAFDRDWKVAVALVRIPGGQTGAEAGPASGHVARWRHDEMGDQYFDPDLNLPLFSEPAVHLYNENLRAGTPETMQPPTESSFIQFRHPGSWCSEEKPRHTRWDAIDSNPVRW